MDSHTASSGKRVSWRWLSWLLPLLLTLGLYWRVIFLPFFWDDVPNFDFATTRTFLQIWTDVSGFPFYRPVLFTFWKAALVMLPPAPTVWFHALSLLVHAANGIIVGQLTRLLVDVCDSHPRRADLTGLLAAVFFVAYPWAAIPISLVASLFHLSVTLSTLSTAWAALLFARTQDKRWLALALTLSLLTPFIHESGIMAGPVASLISLVGSRVLERRRWWYLGLFPLASALFLPIWMAIPKSHEPLAWVGWESIGQSATFFAQSPSYPLQFLARVLMDRLNWSDLASIWAIALPTLLFVVLMLLQARLWRVLIFGLGWIALVSLPSVLALGFFYIVTGPRFLYYPAPGGASLWAALIMTLTARFATPRLQAVTIGGLSLAILIYPVYFIQREITLHQFALSPIWQMADVVRRYPAERHLVINLMDWVANTRASYALGHEGVVAMSSYVSPTQIAMINSGLRAHVEDAVFPPVQTAMDLHYYALHGGIFDWGTLGAHVLNYDRVWLMTYSDQGIALHEAGAVINQPANPPAAYLADFEEKVYLVDGHYSLEGQAMIVTLQWRYIGPDPGATIFRHVFDCAGNVLGLGDGHALERTLPFYALIPGALVRDVRRIPIEARSPDGCYAVEAGLFRADGSRVRVFAADGSEFENDVVLLLP